MRELLSARPAEIPTVTSDTLVAKIATFTSPAFAEGIRQIVLFGATAKIDPKLFEPCLHGTVAKVASFDAGFDENAAKARKPVSGVSAGSNAYAAGLRDGQKIVDWTVQQGEPKIAVEITIEDGATKKTVRYLPAGKPVSVPVFALLEPMPDVCRQSL